MYEELYHHGIKGQKWGVRRYQNADGTYTTEGKHRRNFGVPTNFIKEGGTLKKGSTLYRVGAEEGDPTALNRKYFSTNKWDHRNWKYELYDQNLYYGIASDLKYKTIKDIKIASNTQTGKEFINMLKSKDSNILETVTYGDIRTAVSEYPMKVSKYASNEEYWGNVATATIAAQTKTGQEFINRMLSSGYGGAGDINGTDVSRDPIIIFDPDSSTIKIDEKIYRSSSARGFKNYSSQP